LAARQATRKRSAAARRDAPGAIVWAENGAAERGKLELGRSRPSVSIAHLERAAKTKSSPHHTAANAPSGQSREPEDSWLGAGRWGDKAALEDAAMENEGPPGLAFQ